MFLEYNGERCVLSISRYGNRRLAWTLVSKGRDEVLFQVTANWPAAKELIDSDEFLVLNDEEQEGVLDLLAAADYIMDTGRTVETPSGRIAHVCMRGLAYTGEL